jgi:hypothetical protein
LTLLDSPSIKSHPISLPDRDGTGKTLKQSALQALDEELKVPSRELYRVFQIEPSAKTVSIVVDIRSIGE